MIFERLALGVYAANCYIVGCDATNEVIVVDPGGEPDEILSKVEKLNLKIKYIILTHGHGDHIGGLVELREKAKVPVLIHEKDEELLLDSNKNFSSLMSMKNVELSPNELLKGGELLQLGKLTVEVIHTPGHTMGSISLKIDGIILSGDTLFAGSIGRTDFPGGSYEDIIKSIKEKLMIYEDDVLIFPGHGPATNIKVEKSTNPFIK